MHAPAQAVLQGKKWRVSGPPHVMMQLKRVFAAADKAAIGAIELSDTPEVCRDLVWFSHRHRLDIRPRARCVVQAAKQQEIEALVAQMERPDYVAPDVQLALPLRNYQGVSAELAFITRAILNADEVGLGKTACGIGLLARRECLPAVVVTMTHLPGQWRRELKRFAPELTVHIAEAGKPPKDICQGPWDRKTRRWTRVPFPDVIVLNYHKLSGWVDWLAQNGFCTTLVFDEVQELRHRDTEKWRAARNLREHVTFCKGLSATPIHNYGGEMKAVMDIIKPGVLGTDEEFARAWCGKGDDGSGKLIVTDPDALGAHLRSIGVMLRRTREEVGRELPPIQRILQTIDVGGEELAKVSDQVAELARILLGQGSGIQKMRAATEIDWRLRQATGIEKAPAVAHWVRMLVAQGEKVLLYGWHHAVYKIWRDLLSDPRQGDLKPAFFTGEENTREKEIARARFIGGAELERWKKYDHTLEETDVLIMSLRAGAGLDGLQNVCRVVVKGELDWSPSVHHQAEGRVHRDGQGNSVVVYYLVTEDGSDPYVQEVLGLKTVQSNGILNPGSGAKDPEQRQLDPDHVRKMARAYLQKVGAAPQLALAEA